MITGNKRYSVKNQGLSKMNICIEMIQIRILLLSSLLVLCYASPKNYIPQGEEIEVPMIETLMQDPRFLRILAKTFHQYRQSQVQEEPLPEEYSARMAYRLPSKRNSELLNSLLGLPKNILKSG